MGFLDEGPSRAHSRPSPAVGVCPCDAAALDLFQLYVREQLLVTDSRVTSHQAPLASRRNELSPRFQWLVLRLKSAAGLQFLRPLQHRPSPGRIYCGNGCSPSTHPTSQARYDRILAASSPFLEALLGAPK